MTVLEDVRDGRAPSSKHWLAFFTFPVISLWRNPARPKVAPTSQHGFHPKMDGHWRGQSCHHGDTSFCVCVCDPPLNRDVTKTSGI